MKIKAKPYARALVALAEGKKGKTLDATMRAFVETLAERGDLGRWREIARAVDGAWKERYGAANVSVTTAAPLDKTLRDAIESLAPGAALREEVDPELIGGARLRIDDRLVDGSVRGHLERLKTALSE